MKVLLGVTGSIAAYKIPFLIRGFLKEGHEVRVVATEKALHFVTRETLAYLTYNRIYTGNCYFELPTSLHIDLAKWADVLLIAPADYNIIGKAASSVADDIVSTIVASFDGPVVFAPAMHDVMWNNPILQDKVAYLRKKGYYFSGPLEGELYSGDEGVGRLNEIEYIIEDVIAAYRGFPLKDKKILLVYGRTEEKIDDVRVITNRSSGKMGIEIAREIKKNGGYLYQIVGKTSVEPYRRDEIFFVTDSKEMKEKIIELIEQVDIFIMAAAVSDYRPVVKVKGKIRREDGKFLSLALESTEDILKELSPYKKDKIFVGFALSDDIEKDAPIKLKEKGLDIIVANLPDAMEGEKSTGFILHRDGERINFKKEDKRKVAEILVREIIGRAKHSII